MLHVTTEVGKPGYKEREKRHFPEAGHSDKGGMSHTMRRRRFLHHGHCTVDDTAWQPHAMAVEPKYTDCGPDWKSSLRYIPAPKDETRKNEELWPDKSSHLRTFPGSNGCSALEWSYYTNGYPTGKKCYFGESGQQHKRSEYSCDHVDLDATMGCRRKEHQIDRRNGFVSAARGDNVYQAAEYAPDFFKHGSTVPAVNFGGNGKPRPETFIPLFPLEQPLGPEYAVKARAQRIREDELEVAALEKWRPATPLGQQQQPPQQQKLAPVTGKEGKRVAN